MLPRRNPRVKQFRQSHLCIAGGPPGLDVPNEIAIIDVMPDKAPLGKVHVKVWMTAEERHRLHIAAAVKGTTVTELLRVAGLAAARRAIPRGLGQRKGRRAATNCA